MGCILSTFSFGGWVGGVLLYYMKCKLNSLPHSSSFIV